MPIYPHQQLKDAIHSTESEIEILESERIAYRRFADELGSIHVTTNESVATTELSTMSRGSFDHTPADGSLQTIRTAYRETVMSTQHYEAEYAESLREHVSMEFGSTVATQLVDGQTVTRVLWRSLRDGTTEAIQQRAAVLKSLRSEREFLEQCQSDVASIQDRLNSIHGRFTEELSPADRCEIDDRLSSLESECETLLAHRQQHINDRSRIRLSDDTVEFATYLYGDLDSPFPVLTAVLEIVETARRCRVRNLQ